VNILVFIAGATLILAAVIYAHKNGLDKLSTLGEPRDIRSSATPAPTPTPATPKTPEKPKDDARVFQPNKPPVKPPADKAATVKVSKPVEPAFVGDSEWKQYHRLDCKYAKLIDESKRVSFASASEAFDKGYIPCKVCKPDAPPAQIAENPARPVGVSDGPKESPKPVATRLVGDSRLTRYHRADCKYAKALDESRKVLFATAAEAFANGYLPCRTCNPDLPTVLAELPPLPEPPPDTSPDTSPEKAPAMPIKDVHLTDRQKRDMYKSLCALKEMLAGISPSYRPYEVLSDRYRVPSAAVEAVEAEGKGKSWPKK
jgi:hypothetical protein